MARYEAGNHFWGNRSANVDIKRGGVFQSVTRSSIELLWTAKNMYIYLFHLIVIEFVWKIPIIIDSVLSLVQISGLNIFAKSEE